MQVRKSMYTPSQIFGGAWRKEKNGRGEEERESSKQDWEACSFWKEAAEQYGSRVEGKWSETGGGEAGETAVEIYCMREELIR